MMKKIILNILLVSMTLTMTQCFTEIPQTVKIVPFDEIQQKLEELRKLQTELSDLDVEIIDLQAKIEDKITEINNMVAPQTVPLTYSIGLISTGITGEQVGVPNATVSIDIEGVRTTATSDSDGQVVFEDLRSGIVMVHVAVAGYTDVSFVVDLLVLGDSDYSPTGEEYYVTSAIGLYPTTAANGAPTLSGTLFFDPDRTNDIIDPLDPNYAVVNYNNFSTSGAVAQYLPAERRVLVDGVDNGFPVQPLLDAREQSWEVIPSGVKIFSFVLPNAADYAHVPPGTAGNIVLALYEEMFASTTSAADGTYSLVLPAGKAGNSVRLHFEEFLGNETYFRAEDNITGPPPTINLTTRVREVVYTPLFATLRTSFINPGIPFLQANVNNFTTTLLNAESVPGDFYFGAKTRDE